MVQSSRFGPGEACTNRARFTALLVLATVLAGCGNPAPSPVKEGRSAFSYDDDEIDPANLAPRKGQAKARVRR